MRLTKIKLAGFKSFVDPTVFSMPSNLVGIVGPNGCGKSNLIDAVRWVMGEGSARTLRGESMADVIFNGSASRKPVGQASVELGFDNSAGRLNGPWGRYNEIAVKRLVNRDGQSNYYLNGARCRRRDIMDIFLGTGLGPRSYAIIEQGMIARVVEAKPDELRLFLEEAAGISKYKERRRETETRIRHTRENLDRLNDVREELNRQLKRLQRQAQEAERYRRYRAEERTLKITLLSLRWRRLDEEITKREGAIRRQQTALDAVVAEQRSVEASLEVARQRYGEFNDECSRAQTRCYELGAEITRLELSLKHRRELWERQQDELKQADDGLERVLQQIVLDTARREELQQSLHAAEPELALARAAEQEAAQALAEAEDAMASWQRDWEHHSVDSNAAQRIADVERTRIEQLERQLFQCERRGERLRLERDNLNGAALGEQLEELRWQLRDTDSALVEHKRGLAELEAELAALEQIRQELVIRLDDARGSLQADRGRLASLETLQEAALGRLQEGVQDWLQDNGLARAPRLAEQIEVDEGWEKAAEVVLGPYLDAVCVEGLAGAATALEGLTRGGLALFDVSNGSAGTEVATVGDELLDKVWAPWSLVSLLGGVRTTSGLGEALTRREQLPAAESLVTPDGVWLGRDWLRVTRGDHAKSGVLARERQVQALRSDLACNEERVQKLSEDQDRVRAELRGLEERRGELQQWVNRAHREQTQRAAAVSVHQDRLEQCRVRAGRIEEELEELRLQAEQEQEALYEARLRLEGSVRSMERLQTERQQLTERRQRLVDGLGACRAGASRTLQSLQQREMTLESLRNQEASFRQALTRLDGQRHQLMSRRDQLMAGLKTTFDQGESDSLEDLLEQRLRADETLARARESLAAHGNELQTLERTRAERERRIQELRRDLEEQRLGLGEEKVRRQGLGEKLMEVDGEPPVASGVSAEAQSEGEIQAMLEKLGQRIQRLGPVNLAAIDEFAELSERKTYLDAQSDDLIEALTTLESAIRKIDRETRSRFRDTFGRVDAGLQQLFPRLFGGGQGRLELIGDDVLDAGVAIMARPPGKRISHIQLLSGGEKALTAVALVFAIFQLNPAPFCMLDEVDAPLDEANVGRFGELVKEMSEKVQFIFITHNKSTMEIARHLSGVTMHEPGVSRLVSVDVAEAVRLATE
jgi:chromosome segregation protein